MNGTEKVFEEIIKQVKSDYNHKSESNNSIKALLERLPRPSSSSLSSEKSDSLYAKQINNSANKRQNEHDMLQANQANLKASYANSIKQVININSTLQERYQKLQKLSLHHILAKGKREKEK